MTNTFIHPRILERIEDTLERRQTAYDYHRNEVILGFEQIIKTLIESRGILEHEFGAKCVNFAELLLLELKNTAPYAPLPDVIVTGLKQLESGTHLLSELVARGEIEDTPQVQVQEK